MLTETNFKTYVGYQETDHSCALAYMLSIVKQDDDWVRRIGRMSTDEVVERLSDPDRFQQNSLEVHSLEVQKHVVMCDLSLDQMLERINAAFRTFPKTDVGKRGAQARIAMHTRRGAGNKELDDIVLYRGNNELDVCMVVVHDRTADLYGICMQDNFSQYGYILE